MEQGPSEKNIIEQCIRDRRPLPDAIANAPELGLGLDFFFIAFLDLTTCRQVGNTIGPIDWMAIQRYAEVYDVVGEQRDDLFYHVQRLDAAYLEWYAAKQAKQAKQMEAARGRKNPPARTRR